jgi:L-lactate dehydrogenase
MNLMHFQPARVAVVGTGNVGSTFAYTLLLSGLAAEIVLIDTNQVKAEGEAMDLEHAIPFAHPTQVRTGTYADCAQAAVVVITAGAAQKPGETRLDLASRNGAIIRQIVDQITRQKPEGILLITTNPVDVMTYAAWKLSGLSAGRVIGSGTILDTSRFRYLLSQFYGVDPHSVHAHIIGEHGDSEVPAWSLANISGMRLADFCTARGWDYDQNKMDQLFLKTRNAAYEIIKRKGATYYAVAAGLTRIVEAILRNQKTMLSVSSLIRDYYDFKDVCFSLPAVISQEGVEWVLHLDLNAEEIEQLRRSVQVLKKAVNELKLEER